jgi:hypothetical protein
MNTCGLHGDWQCEDALLKATICKQVKVEAQHLQDNGGAEEYELTGLRRY